MDVQEGDVREGDIWLCFIAFSGLFPVKINNDTKIIQGKVNLYIFFYL